MRKQPAWKKREREFYFGPLEVEVINDDIEHAIKILKNKMSKDGILSELKRRRFAEKPSEAKRRKRREAQKKLRKSRGKKARQRQQDNQSGTHG